MELKVVTIYSDIDDAWLTWYLKRLEKSGQPQLIECVKALSGGEEPQFTNQIETSNPKSQVTTTYTLKK